MVQLNLSAETVRNAIFTHTDGQVLYKTAHPFQMGCGKTTLYKIMPNDDPMDMRDRFTVIGQIEWHYFGSSVLHLDGQTMRTSDFIPSHGILGRKRTFTGPDGRKYRWDMPFSGVTLSRDDETRSEVARYHKGSLGIIGPKRYPRLEIDPSVEHILDIIVLTFVYMEKLRMDRDEREIDPVAGTFHVY